MTTNPRSPMIRKGALVTKRPSQPTPRVIPFQYNPATLSRTLEARTGGEGGVEAMRLAGAPIETIKADVILDAYDRMNDGIGGGIHADLADLELLLYPDSSRVIANSALMAIGTIEIIPPESPLTLFVWGPQRVLPVRITEFAVTEEEYNTDLQPIRATVSLGLRVLSYSDVPVGHEAHHLFLSHQLAKEALSHTRPQRSIDAVLRDDTRLP